MTELRLETLEIPAARLGPDNPLPPLHAYRTVSHAPTSEGDAPVVQPDYPDRGNEASILPYRLQDDYDRIRQPRRFKTAVLENDILRATFMLELGGRLWSLFHKPSGRDLLHVNPVFQPANLAVRDAWFSGGVEWNLSIIGHCPFTCSPVFAARVMADDGTPILRLYEFERIRAVPFQVDFYLPPGSPFLFVRPRISNPNDHAIPMYWWSNIAVDEVDGIRVLAPASRAFYHDYDRSLKSQDLPLRDGQDVTYPTRRPSAADLYFRIPRDRRPWIAALDPRGRGLVHTSTQRLIGRKFFNWGMCPGGRRWQEHLAAPGHQYIEIQGGLATTQTEYVTMPAGAKWEWLEAYGLMQADPRAMHGPDWTAALHHVEENLEAMLPRAAMEDRLQRSVADADRAPAEILQSGSGWGALEQRRRDKARLAPLASAGLPFPDSTLGPEQQPWLALLDHGAMPAAASQSAGAYMTQPAWRAMLEDAITAGRGVHWLSLLHLGIMRYRAADAAGAGKAWERSLIMEPSAMAYRNLAILAADAGDKARSVALWTAAARARPDLPAIVIEACDALLRAGRNGAMRELIASLPSEIQAHARVRLLDTFAAVRTGDLAAVAAFFARPSDITNIREGELSLSELWFEWHEAELAQKLGVPIDDLIRRRAQREHPLPKEFDFRMKADDVALTHPASGGHATFCNKICNIRSLA